MTSQRAPRRSWLRVHPFTIAVALVALLVTAALAWTAHTVNVRTEDRLLRLKVAETGAVLQAALPRIQTTLAPAVKFAETGRDPVAGFTDYISDYAGEKKEFGSASLWQLNPGSPPRLVTVVGQQPELATHPDQLAAVLNRAATGTPGVRVVPLFAKPNRRIGYAYSAGGPHHYVIYTEQPLPANGQVPRTPGTPFSDLTFALYLGKTATPANLIEANAAHLGRRTASAVVPFGDQSLDVVASADGPLGGALSQDLWWIVAIAGVLLSLAAAAITEHLLRRRETAVRLAAHVQSLLQEQRSISDSREGSTDKST